MPNEPILNQEEVEALLSGMNEGRLELDGEALPAGEVRRYELGREVRILRGRMPTFELINERLARAYQASIIALLRRAATVQVKPFRTLKYSEFIAELEYPTGINVVRLNPLRGLALIVMSSTMIASIVDNYFGGKGRIRPIQNRDFTNAELRLVQIFREAAMQDLASSWSNVLPLTPEFVQTESNPHFANVMNPNEVLLVTDYQVEILEAKSSFQTVVPYNVIEPIRHLLERSFRDDTDEEDRRLSRSLREELHDAEVTLNAVLGRSHLMLSRLIDLKPGDIIPCEFDGTALVYAEDIPVFRGRTGQSRGQLAVRVEHLLGGSRTAGGSPANTRTKPNPGAKPTPNTRANLGEPK